MEIPRKPSTLKMVNKSLPSFPFFYHFIQSTPWITSIPRFLPCPFTFCTYINCPITEIHAIHTKGICFILHGFPLTQEIVMGVGDFADSKRYLEHFQSFQVIRTNDRTTFLIAQLSSRTLLPCLYFLFSVLTSSSLPPRCEVK